LIGNTAIVQFNSQLTAISKQTDSKTSNHNNTNNTCFLRVQRPHRCLHSHHGVQLTYSLQK